MVSFYNKNVYFLKIFSQKQMKKQSTVISGMHVIHKNKSHTSQWSFPSMQLSL
jgi:hypothetical protein